MKRVVKSIVAQMEMYLLYVEEGIATKHHLKNLALLTEML